MPTYQERANVATAVKTASAALAGIPHEIVVVDDASPDGTADVAEGLAAEGVPVRVVRREGERGLARAVIAGFRATRGEIIVCMDADGSHPADLLPALVRQVEDGADLALASRYAPGGRVEGWPWRRRAVSRAATRLAAHLTQVQDPMSGYFATRRGVIDGVELDPRGFKIGLDLLVRAKPARVVEVPFVFRDRERGRSKLRAGVYAEYVAHLWQLTRIANPAAFQALKYLAVGALGMLVNLALFGALVVGARIAGEVALFASFAGAVVFNFALNKAWTFRDPSRAPRVVAGKLARFAAIALVGLGINWGAYSLLTGLVATPAVLAQAVGIVVAAAWNFEASRRFAFRRSG